jgi:sporulation and spore germination protein/immunoglobulin-like protein involved in spore germination
VRRLALPVLILVLALGGCGGDDDEAAPGGGGTTSVATTTTAETTAGETTPVESTLAVNVYFLRGEKLGVTWRPAAGLAVARGAMEGLLEGPTAAERAAGLSTEIPEGTELLGVSKANGTVTVDLSGAFDDGGGSASMQARVAQVVATLTQFPGFERVAFRIDGQPVQSIGGEGVVVDPPVGREEIEAQTPAILVESPGVLQTVASPLRISGTANTFEATFQVKVTAADGSELYRNFVTATSGSGVRGTFDETFELAEGAADGPVTLTVWEDNADNGQPVNVVEIPLRLAG